MLRALPLAHGERRAPAAVALLGPTLVLGLCAHAGAQTTYSIDYRAAQKAAPDPCTGVPITEGDILGVFNPPNPACVGNWPTLGPLPVPPIRATGGPGGLGLPAHPAAVGLPPGTPGSVEVDALSYGRDGPALQTMPAGSYWFSVDGSAFGFPGPAVPEVASEGVLGAREAGADVFTDVGLPSVPLAPFATPVPGNVGAIDGDGLTSTTPFAYPGLGLVDLLVFPPPVVADTGDNLDAVDVDGPRVPQNDGLAPFASPLRTYFSLDALSAPANGGFSGADVLVSTAGGPPVLFAPAAALGLDLGGFNTDDLDALALYKVVPGPGAFVPSVVPLDWLGGGTDMLLFSVRTGSAVIGMPDSIFGIPIGPGDVLTTPLPTGSGGVSPYPGMFIGAENLGLMNQRSGLAQNDELDALDVVCRPVLDCDGNGIEDAIDIALFGAADLNANGMQDACEDPSGLPVTPPYTYCTAKTNSLNCIPFLSWSGTATAGSIPQPFFCLGNDVRPAQFGFLLYGFKKANLNFHGGKLCVKGPVRVLPPKTPKAVPWGCTGAQFSKNFNKTIAAKSDPLLTAGQRVFVQYYQRDPGNPLGFNDSLTDGMSFLIAP